MFRMTRAEYWILFYIFYISFFGIFKIDDGKNRVENKHDNKKNSQNTNKQTLCYASIANDKHGGNCFEEVPL